MLLLCVSYVGVLVIFIDSKFCNLFSHLIINLTCFFLQMLRYIKIQFNLFSRIMTTLHQTKNRSCLKKTQFAFSETFKDHKNR